MQHLTQQDLAKRWRLSPRTLERWRAQGKGPAFLKLGSRCVYSAEAVESFEQARVREQTAVSESKMPSMAGLRS